MWHPFKFNVRLNWLENLEICWPMQIQIIRNYFVPHLVVQLNSILKYRTTVATLFMTRDCVSQSLNSTRKMQVTKRYLGNNVRECQIK